MKKDTQAMMEFVRAARRGRLQGHSPCELLASQLVEALKTIGEDLMLLDSQSRAGFYALVETLVGPFQTSEYKAAAYTLLDLNRGELSSKMESELIFEGSNKCINGDSSGNQKESKTEQVGNKTEQAENTRRCKYCGGGGWLQSGLGRYGDCNGDAGEGLKPCLQFCPECGGLGVLEDDWWAG